MEWLLWILVILAFLMALGAWRRSARLSDTLDTLRRDASIGKGDHEELKTGLDGLRRLTAQMADGRKVDAEMVRENRLFRTTTAKAVQQAVDAGEQPFVLDVRTDEEWVSGHIPGAVHIPLDVLKERLHEVPRDGRPMYVTCAGGQRSASACDYLSGRGYLEVFNVEGGMNSWQGERVREA